MQYTRTELLYRTSYITIEYNSTDHWLYVNWKGYQNYDTVVAGSEKLLEFIKEFSCHKILNNNTNVEGQWSSAAKWCAENWLPRALDAGMQWFAWVYSPSLLSKLSADKTLKLAQTPDFINVFDDLDLAKDWLRAQL